ncbi:unnamed protein product, partial [Ascophyllum nodosum]
EAFVATEGEHAGVNTRIKDAWEASWRREVQFYCCVGILLKLVVVEMFFTRLITMSKTS